MKLEEIEKICEDDELRLGPWFVEEIDVCGYHQLYNVEPNIIEGDDRFRKQDATFIAMARTELPKLLAIAKQVDCLIIFWETFEAHNIHVKELTGSVLDPRFKPEHKLGLKELLAKLEKE